MAKALGAGYLRPFSLILEVVRLMQSLAMYQLIAMTRQEAHQAPVVPFTIEQAHRVMQFHVVCRATRCPRKAAALQALIAAGRVVPSASKPR